MKKFFIAIGIFFSILIVIGAIAIFYMFYAGPRLDASSKAYVDNIIPKIAAHWDAEELIAESSPELRRVVSDDKLMKLCFMMEKALGPIKKYEGSEGESFINFDNHGKTVTAHYIARASFENQKADLHVRLILEDGKWKFLEFNVMSNP